MLNQIHLQTFLEAMTFHGLVCKDPIIADGKIHRFHVSGDRAGSKNGWYVFFGKVGVYGSWKTGEKFTWYAKRTSMSDTIYAKIRQQLDQARSDNKVAKHKGHLAVAEAVQKKWFTSQPANPEHPYLREKCVKPHGLRQDKHYLIVPLCDFHGTLWSLQTIFANGGKRFETGGRVSGLFSPIGLEKPNGFSRLVICEGWATGASLHEIMGDMVLCAMNAGNLVHVAKGAREQFPDAEIIIAADNDRFTEGNPGVAKAMEAARLTWASVMIPQFPEGVEGTDYNDAAKLGWRG